MNYLSNHEIGQERMQQFVKEADEMRRARKLGGEEKKANFSHQLRNIVVKTLSAIIR